MTKYSAISSILFLSLFLYVPSVFASVDIKSNSESNISVQQSGGTQSTTCINGKCTSTGSSQQSVVCINGECKTYEGDVDYKSQDGKTQVTVENDSIENEPTKKIDAPTRFISPTIGAKLQEMNEKITKAKEEMKHMTKEQDGFLSQFLKKELEKIHKFWEDLF